RIGGGCDGFVVAGVADRPAPEQERQGLAVPAEASREWAKTIAISTRPPESVLVEEPVDVAAEADVIQPVVSELATAEAPIVEPEALPDLPGLSDEAEDAAVELPTQTAPAVAEAAPVLELATNPVDEPETELEPVAEPEPLA